MLTKHSLKIFFGLHYFTYLWAFQKYSKNNHQSLRLYSIDQNESNLQESNLQEAPLLKEDPAVVTQRLSNMNEMIADEGARGIDFSGLSKDPEYYFPFRESEIKHGRIAMLAAFGWPFSELYHYTLSKSMGLEDMLLETNGKAPSVLNGGLDNTYVLLALGTFFAVGAVLELEEMKRRNPNDPAELQNFMEMWREDGWDAPGNYGFDPLGLGKLFCPTTRSKVFMQGIEINNGRLAMLATVGFVVQEYITGIPLY